jgi:hypothetical protein
MRILTLFVVLAGTLLLEACSACGPPPAAAKMSWGVKDVTAGTVTHEANGATMTINQGDQYFVVLYVQEPEGIKKLEVSGSGSLSCAAPPSSTGQSFTFTDPNPVSVSIPTQTENVTQPGLWDWFAITKPFDYAKYDCGTFQFGNMTKPAEFFAASGTLQFQGADTSWKGTKRTATLTLQF